jgi:hypothetical protein
MQTKMEYLPLVLAWILIIASGLIYLFALAYVVYNVTKALLEENKYKNKYGKGSK